MCIKCASVPGQRMDGAAFLIAFSELLLPIRPQDWGSVGRIGPNIQRRGEGVTDLKEFLEVKRTEPGDQGNTESEEGAGYEVHGMEKIPEEGPALIIFYHGAIPIDFYYFMAKIFIHKGRTCRVVADHFVFKIPGFSLLLDVFCAIHGPREKCVEILRSGHLLAISPGGVREALISDETYNIVWGNRKGFAQVAIDAKVPIIPMFTENIREGFRSLGGTRLFRWLYEKFRYPFAPMYGGFPVKLRTYLGDPIPYDPKITAEELAEKTKDAVQALIDKHQRIPGNIMSALLERFHNKQKIN
ncbi:transmembrane protein 68 isoform X2 [Hippopotamus amphibius kiboko]|uniref:transmembrane protein 68 isoform X2 n=1 Tax=Hippopotamus amphibius kiboko TaxID=575201 RepID=UPI002598F18F|nr:transmembrane protein 68 isoform X2 [Hippopotamus amphibius kiboko]